MYTLVYIIRLIIKYLFKENKKIFKMLWKIRAIFVDLLLLNSWNRIHHIVYVAMFEFLLRLYAIHYRYFIESISSFDSQFN